MHCFLAASGSERVRSLGAGKLSILQMDEDMSFLCSIWEEEERMKGRKFTAANDEEK